MKARTSGEAPSPSQWLKEPRASRVLCDVHCRRRKRTFFGSRIVAQGRNMRESENPSSPVEMDKKSQKYKPSKKALSRCGHLRNAETKFTASPRQKLL